MPPAGADRGPTTPASPGPEGPDGHDPAGADGLRVLSLSALYPPHHLGGYEVVHRGADRRLRARGMAVRTLVTTDRRPDVAPDAPEDPDVHRHLRWYWRDHAFPRLGARRTLALERHDHRVLRGHLAAHRPDVVVTWALGGMPQSLVGALRRTGIPLVHVVHDLWPAYGPLVDPFARSLRRLGPLGGPVARALGSDRPAGIGGSLAGGATPTERETPPPVLLNSLHLADELVRGGSIPTGWDVAAPGVAVPARAPRARAWSGRLLCLGRLDERKGIDVAVDALAALPGDWTLTVAGAGDDAVAAALRAQAARLGLADRVDLRGFVDAADRPALLAEHDAVVFPVRWAEPFGLVPLEAMAAGRPVIATAGGGQASYLRDGANALVVPVDDPAALAAAARRLADGEDLRTTLRSGGRATAREHDEARFHDAVEAAARQASGARRRITAW